MEHKKKVLFTATVDSHILHFHLPFLKLFKEKGYEVHVATNGKEEIPYCDKKHTISFEKSPFKINNIKAIKQLKKICNEEKYEVIITNTPMGSVVTRLSANNSRKKYKTRVIYIAHGFHFYKGSSLKSWIMFYSVEKWMSKYTDTIITINKEDYNLAKNKFSKRCKNIEYIAGVGIDESKFTFAFPKKEKEQLKQSLGISDTDFVMIYPARLDKNKNQEFLINCMEKLVKKNSYIKLLLVGEDELNGYYQKIVKTKKLDNNVLILGYRKDILKLMRISNLGVSSSIREGLGLNVIEEIASGIPELVSFNRGHSEIIIDGENGFFYKDEKDFIDKVNYFMNNTFIPNKKTIEKFYLKNIIRKMNDIFFK